MFCVAAIYRNLAFWIYNFINKQIDILESKFLCTNIQKQLGTDSENINL